MNFLLLYIVQPISGFIDSANIDCFGTGLPTSMSKEAYQYRHFQENCKLTLQIFEVKAKSEEIVHFLIYLQFSMCFF